jgi:hypothetical protein
MEYEYRVGYFSKNNKTHRASIVLFSKVLINAQGRIFLGNE